MQTSRFNLNLLYTNQANKELLLNENMNMLNYLINPAVKSMSTNAPPPSPDYGDIYIVPVGASEWKAMTGSLALYIDEWVHIPPKSGMIAWVLESHSLWLYDGTEWIVIYSKPLD